MLPSESSDFANELIPRHGREYRTYVTEDQGSGVADEYPFTLAQCYVGLSIHGSIPGQSPNAVHGASQTLALALHLLSTACTMVARGRHPDPCGQGTTAHLGTRSHLHALPQNAVADHGSRGQPTPCP